MRLSFASTWCVFAVARLLFRLDMAHAPRNPVYTLCEGARAMTTLQLPHSFQIQRCGLMLAVLVLVNTGQLRADVIKVEPPTSDRVVYESKERPDIHHT